jgi:negative regulator of flagellin synthesis FlgM
MIMVDSVSIRPTKSPQLRSIPFVKNTAVSPQNSIPSSPQQASLPVLIQMAAALTQQGTPIDYTKIAQVRHAIANGDYKIDPDRIADAILRFHSKKDA